MTTNDKRLRIDNNSDNLIDSYLADDLSKSDYYPYGMSRDTWFFSMENPSGTYPALFAGAMVGRNTNLSDYRFGYQGSEMDNEHKGNGNSYTTYFRQLDPRLGRWMSIDPVWQPWQSPYNSMDDNPIGLNDVLGDKVEPGAGGGSTKSYFGGKVKVYTNREGGSFLWVGNMSVKIPPSIGKVINGAGKFGQAMKTLFKSVVNVKKGPLGTELNPILLEEFEVLGNKPAEKQKGGVTTVSEEIGTFDNPESDKGWPSVHLNIDWAWSLPSQAASQIQVWMKYFTKAYDRTTHWATQVKHANGWKKSVWDFFSNGQNVGEQIENGKTELEKLNHKSSDNAHAKRNSEVHENSKDSIVIINNSGDTVKYRPDADTNNIYNHIRATGGTILK